MYRFGDSYYDAYSTFVHVQYEGVTVYAIIALHVVAIDLPGHGRSSHRPMGSFYHAPDYVADVKYVVDGKLKSFSYKITLRNGNCN